MWLTSGRASGRKTLLQYFSLTPLERECYEGEVQPYRKTDYKPIIYHIYNYRIIMFIRVVLLININTNNSYITIIISMCFH